MTSKEDPPAHLKSLDRLTQKAASGQELVAARLGKKIVSIQSNAPEFPRTFLDTNILFYAEDAKESRKREIAVQLILDHRRQHTGVVSLQVLQEFFVNTTRKLGLDPSIARYKVEFHARFDVVEPSVADLLAAIDIHRLRGISFWDALILHCAKKAGCRELLTEDMQHGQVIDSVRIVNPFL